MATKWRVAVCVFVASGLGGSDFGEGQSISESQPPVSRVSTAEGTVSLASSDSHSTYGKLVTLTARVPAGATGKIVFEDDGAAIGAAILAGATATFTTSTLAVGTHSMTAVYSGDANFSDFNGDGLEDLVVANYTDGTVDLLLSAVSGGYTLDGPFPAGDNPYSAAVADIDQDGTPDIVVSNCFSNSTGVLLSGTQIAVPYSGLALTPGHQVYAAYTPDSSSAYGPSTSSSVTAP